MMKRVLFLMLIALMTLTISSCGGGFFQEDVVTIESIETFVNDKGDVEVTITYLDDVLEPVTFTIPKGKEGEGIKSILTTRNQDKDSTTITISYTERDEVVEFEIANGVGVKNVTSELNEETNERYLIIEYTNGTKSEPFLLPQGEKGDKGDPGNGIASIITEEQEDGSTKLTISFTDEEMEPIELFVPAPKQGRGIASMVASEVEGKYILSITYSDDSYEELELVKPREPNAWIKGNSAPNSADGNDGDYYFDTANKRIYSKENGRWNQIVDFNQSLDFYEVRFNLNSLEEIKEWYYKGEKLAIPYSNQQVTIGVNGNWFIGDVDTEIVATVGVPGQTAYEAYCLTTSDPLPEEQFNLKLIVDETFDYPYILKTTKECADYIQGQQYYFIQRNTYFKNSGYTMPIPQRDGYIFLGWFTEREFNINSANFTDLTIVLSDLELFARWEKIN